MSRKTAEIWTEGNVFSFRISYAGTVVSGYSTARTFDAPVAQRMVRHYAVEAQRKNVRFFYGLVDRIMKKFGRASDADDGAFIYFIPRSSPVEVCALAELGGRNFVTRSSIRFMQTDPEIAKWLHELALPLKEILDPEPATQRRRVRKFLYDLYRQHPFQIEALDRSVLVAPFNDRISKTDASKIAEQVLALDPDAASAAEPLTMEKYIHKNQTLLLWWD